MHEICLEDASKMYLGGVYLFSLSPQEKVSWEEGQGLICPVYCCIPIGCKWEALRVRGGFSLSPLILFPNLKHENIILIQRS